MHFSGPEKNKAINQKIKASELIYTLSVFRLIASSDNIATIS